MKLLNIVYKDASARKKRILFAALGVMIGTMTVAAILTVSLAGQQRIYQQLEKYGPNLTIVPAISTLDMKLGSVNLGQLSVGENYISQDRLPEIRQIADSEIRKALDIQGAEDIATIAPKLFVQAKIKEHTVTLVGVQPKHEMAIKTWWMVGQGDYFDQNRHDQVLAGSVAAELLDIKVGDSLDLNGAKVTVAGILDETGSNDDYQLFADLETVQTAYNKPGMLSVIDVRALCNGCPVDVIANGVNNQIPGVRAVAVKQVAEGEMGMVERVNRFMMALGGVTLLIGLFAVITTMLSSVNERIKDIGIMRAVGASRWQIIRVFIYEAVIVGIIGGILGYLGGSGLAFLVGPLIFEGATVSIVPAYFPVSLGLAILVAVLATIYPAHRASRIKVADCFRSL